MENWWCDFSKSYFDMFTAYILAYCFRLCNVHVENICSQYILFSSSQALFFHVALLLLLLRRCRRRRCFFPNICISYWKCTLLIPSQREIVWQNIKLFYCIFWLRLVATWFWYFFLLPSLFLCNFFHQHHHCFCCCCSSPFLACEVIFHTPKTSMFICSNSEWILEHKHIPSDNAEEKIICFGIGLEMQNDCVVCSHLHNIKIPCID